MEIVSNDGVVSTIIYNGQKYHRTIDNIGISWVRIVTTIYGDVQSPVFNKKAANALSSNVTIYREKLESEYQISLRDSKIKSILE